MHGLWLQWPKNCCDGTVPLHSQLNFRIILSSCIPCCLSWPCALACWLRLSDRSAQTSHAHPSWLCPACPAIRQELIESWPSLKCLQIRTELNRTKPSPECFASQNSPARCSSSDCAASSGLRQSACPSHQQCRQQSGASPSIPGMPCFGRLCGLYVACRQACK